jgi:hypothetical protein
MRSARALLVAASAIILASACEATTADDETPAPVETEAASPGGTDTDENPPPFPTDGNGFDPGNFGPDANDVDNTYLPLVPGTQFFYEGSSLNDEGERIEHSVIFTVTGLTKEIAGVHTVVGWDRDFEEGELVEKELIFFAQDRDGNVWHLGQYAELYDGGEFEGAAPWIVGYVEGAKAGVAMPAEHHAGDPKYSEGYAPPPYFWQDFARVFETGQRTCVPAGCYEDVLVTEEFEPRKPGAFQLKFYAPDVGYVRVGWRGAKEEEREVLVLTRLRHLDEEQLAAVHAEALAMEARANVYGMTNPVEPRP